MQLRKLLFKHRYNPIQPRQINMDRKNSSESLEKLLQTSSARHSHLCPRQVLGVRMGLYGAALLGLELPVSDKRLWVIVETDGCFADGIEVSTGASVGHRTLRVEDYGKVAATFVDAETGEAVRVAPRLDVRQRAPFYVTDEPRQYFAQLKAYQGMPDKELFSVQAVRLAPSIEVIISRAGVRVNCAACGEEIINEREVMIDGQPCCRSCAGRAYYQPVDATLISDSRERSHTRSVPLVEVPVG
jgi:formylmethanofuran dehydrogenase subunit E